ncbi:MAG: magnesium transporter [Xanthobacteraceae bacterium]|nr:MAG: magnesium transporter [Xanthobacteraceae bacterium]
MLTVYLPSGAGLVPTDIPGGEPVPGTAIWIDLLSPLPSEDVAVERLIAAPIPTREEMQEIEISSRLYVEDGALYMTATLMCATDTPTPRTTEVTFILAGHRLVTVRYDNPRPFALVATKLGRTFPEGGGGQAVMLEVLDAVIDRLADILERAAGEVDQVSRDIFEPNPRTGHSRRYANILIAIGSKGDLTSKIRESLVSIGRLLLFLSNETEAAHWGKEVRAQLKTMHRDVQSLSDHASYLSNKITFVLDAMLGVVNLEQNNIIKLFSVMAVVLMPPTLIASIYGMNFRHMPELETPWGYPLALLSMLAAAVLPYLWFKHKKWL